MSQRLFVTGSPMRYLLIGLVLVIGIAVSVTFSQIVRKSETERIQNEFRDDAAEQIFTLRAGLESRINRVTVVASFYAASNFVDREEFATFSRFEANTATGVQAFSWIPRVRAESLAQFEQSAVQDGLVDFYVKQIGSDGSLAPVSDRAEYFPVFYINPVQGNESALGFDLASNPARLEALEIARDTGDLTMTAPITLVQETGNQAGFLAFTPIYENGSDVSTVEARRRNFIGLASAVFRVDDLTHDALGIQPGSDEFRPVSLRIEDMTNSGETAFLFSSDQDVGERSDSDRLLVSDTIDLGGRSWLVTATPTDPTSITGRQWIPLLVLFAGLGLTFLTSGFLYTTVRRADTVARLVDQRTSELSEANDNLIYQMSERQKDEAKILDSQARTQAIVDLAVDAIIAIDDRGTIESANKAAEEVFGFNADEMIGNNVSMLMPSPYREEHDQYIDNYLRSGEKKIIGVGREVVGQRSDGSIFPMELSVSQVQLHGRRMFTGIVRDITDRRAAEELLKKSEADKESLLQAIPDLMFRMNSKGVFIDYRQGTDGDAIGFPTDVIGMNIVNVMPFKFAETTMDNIIETLSTGTAHTFEYQFPVPDWPDRVSDIESRVHVSGPDEVLVLIRDITERRALERMKEDFVSTVSHELRTPLTSIRGVLGLLEGAALVDASDQVKQMLQIGISNTDRLTRLINDILDLERLDAGKIELQWDSCSVASLVEGAIKGMNPIAAEARVAIKSEVVDLEITTDADRTIQVLTNLVSNAIKFSESGDSITVNANQCDEGVHFSVVDEGRGIPSDKLESIFGRFQQVDASDSREKGGSGLGLAICKNIVDLHGGRIWVESELDKGSAFHFILPLEPDSDKADAEAA